MSEEANTRLGEETESSTSGLLLSVEPVPGGEPRSAQRVDNEDTDADGQDKGDALTDVDGTDESDADGTDTGDGTDETDTGDSDSTDTSKDTDRTDS